jgi:uncharacterized protein YkuJ
MKFNGAEQYFALAEPRQHNSMGFNTTDLLFLEIHSILSKLSTLPS